MRSVRSGNGMMTGVGRGALALLLSLAVAGTAYAQKAPQEAGKQAPAAPKKEEFVPSEGQEGKDVIWLPTADAHVGRMLDMAKVTKSDYVIDLGSGDGRTVIAAAKRGAKAHGIEFNPDMVGLSQRRAKEAGVADRATFQQGDIFVTDFSKATVLTMFLLPDINIKLRPKILDMKPGTRIVSNTFDMGEWKADQVSQSKVKCTQYCTAYMWIVPAKAAGTWTMSNGATLTLSQEFQVVTGTLTPKKGKPIKITSGKLDGARLTITAGKRTYTGRVAGDRIEGIGKKKAKAWNAKRASG